MGFLPGCTFKHPVFLLFTWDGQPPKQIVRVRMAVPRPLCTARKLVHGVLGRH